MAGEASRQVEFSKLLDLYNEIEKHPLLTGGRPSGEPLDRL
jgi:hypothetical protein